MSYPIVITNLANVICVVVGGGAVAERKVRDLLAGGAQPRVIAPTLTAALAQWRDEGRIAHAARRYAPGDLAGAFLVVAATNDRATNAAIAASSASNALVNIADDPAAGNFATTAAVRRGDLLIAVSSGIPALSAKIRRDLDARYGVEYAALTALLRALRGGAARDLPPAARTAFWRALVCDEVLDWVRAGQLARGEAFARDLLEQVRNKGE